MFKLLEKYKEEIINKNINILPALSSTQSGGMNSLANHEARSDVNIDEFRKQIFDLLNTELIEFFTQDEEIGTYSPNIVVRPSKKDLEQCKEELEKHNKEDDQYSEIIQRCEEKLEQYTLATKQYKEKLEQYEFVGQLLGLYVRSQMKTSLNFNIFFLYQLQHGCFCNLDIEDIKKLINDFTDIKQIAPYECYFNPQSSHKLCTHDEDSVEYYNEYTKLSGITQQIKGKQNANHKVLKAISTGFKKMIDYDKIPLNKLSALEFQTLLYGVI
tara:strand:+ start:16 stop:828 length:813 start_codon:yes stop_codon:yes gene_type:complete